MTKHLALFGALISMLACGGTTDNGDGPFDGGASSGGGGSSSTAGKGSGSNGNRAGASSGGAVSGGSGHGGATAGGVGSSGSSSGGVTGGGAGKGGVSSGGSSSGGSSSGGISSAGNPGAGSPSTDPRCPDTTPSGSCDDEGLKCDYSAINNCLCASSAGTAYCAQVDPTCMGPTQQGSGGASAKIAAPARQRCSCSADKWTCVLGI